MTHQFQALNACAQHWPLRPRSSSGVPGYALPWEGGEARRQLHPPPSCPILQEVNALPFASMLLACIGYVCYGFLIAGKHAGHSPAWQLARTCCRVGRRTLHPPARLRCRLVYLCHRGCWAVVVDVVHIGVLQVQQGPGVWAGSRGMLLARWDPHAMHLRGGRRCAHCLHADGGHPTTHQHPLAPLPFQAQDMLAGIILTGFALVFIVGIIDMAALNGEAARLMW